MPQHGWQNVTIKGVRADGQFLVENEQGATFYVPWPYIKPRYPDQEIFKLLNAAAKDRFMDQFLRSI